MSVTALRRDPRIRLYLTRCEVCSKPATTLVRWRYQPSPRGQFTGRCKDDTPWGDPTAEYVPLIRGAR